MHSTQYLHVLRSRGRHALRMRGVTRIYPGGVRALDDVSLTVDVGLCALVGPDGAGKSTLLRILALDERPDRGSVQLGDLDTATQAAQLRRLMCAVPPALPIRPDLSLADAIAHLARAQYGHGGHSIGMRVEAQLRQVGLWEMRVARVDALPAAMHWRLTLAYALVESPRVLLLDEPLAHLPSREAREFLVLLQEIAQARIVVISASDVTPLRHLPMHLEVMHRGRIVREGAVDRLLDELRGRVWGAVVSPEEAATIAAEHVLLSCATHANVAAIEVLSDVAPMTDFHAVEPDVSHVYREALADIQM